MQCIGGIYSISGLIKESGSTSYLLGLWPNKTDFIVEAIQKVQTTRGTSCVCTSIFCVVKPFNLAPINVRAFISGGYQIKWGSQESDSRNIQVKSQHLEFTHQNTRDVQLYTHFLLLITCSHLLITGKTL